MRQLLTCLAVLCVLAGCKKDFPDLATSSITATPINPLPGATVSVSVKVTNFGGESASPCTWSVTRDGVFNFTGGTVPGLAPSESTTIAFPVTETEAATHTYQIIVNANNVVDESNYADNSATIRVTWALSIDLQAAPLTLSPVAPTSALPVTLNATVTNAATAPGTAAGVTWSVTRDGIPKYAVGVIPNLAPGASIAVPATLPAQTVGPHTYDFIIDPDGRSTDSDRSNNIQSITVTVTPIGG